MPQQVLDSIEAHRRWLASEGNKGLRANFTGQDLSGLQLTGKDLRQAIMIEANLSKAQLAGSNLSGAILLGAQLSDAFARRTQFQGAQLLYAVLRGADLSRADLRNASLISADLRRATLDGAELGGANLTGANLSGVVFFPASTPDGRMIASAVGLHLLRFSPVLNSDPPREAWAHQMTAAGVDLRDKFKKGGFRQQERDLTYAINRVHHFLGVEDLLRYVFFELTSEWGRSPLRPLVLMLAMAIICWGIYLGSLLWSKPGQKGIYKRVKKQPARSRQQASQAEYARVHLHYKNCNPLLIAFLFSLSSSLSIGWGEVRLENWLAKFNPKGYELRATGWLKTVSATQSLLSAFFLTLWILTYFGRPFE